MPLTIEKFEYDVAPIRPAGYLARRSLGPRSYTIQEVYTIDLMVVKYQKHTEKF